MGLREDIEHGLDQLDNVIGYYPIDFIADMREAVSRNYPSTQELTNSLALATVRADQAEAEAAELRTLLTKSNDECQRLRLQLKERT